MSFSVSRDEVTLGNYRIGTDGVMQARLSVRAPSERSSWAPIS